MKGRSACTAARARDIPVAGGDEQRLQAALVQTMATASPRRREVLALAAMGGLAPAAIAAALGLSLETVSVQLHEGLNEVVSRISN